jgi:TPR repeat protein
MFVYAADTYHINLIDAGDSDDSEQPLLPRKEPAFFGSETQDPVALFALGVDYQFGQNGVEVDLEKAASLFLLSASEGHAKAQNRLGVCYANGTGLPMDEKAAVKYWSLAADQGDTHAQFNLAYFHEAGKGGLVKDFAEALRLYRLAAAQGHKLAPKKMKQVILKM